VISALSELQQVAVTVCLTGQHPEMARSALFEFEIECDFVLPIDPKHKTLAERFSYYQQSLASRLANGAYDWIIVHGDTMSTLGGAMAAFHAGVRIAHVEAGLRTWDTSQPWPEEAYRRMVAVISDIHFAPTYHAERNLLAEGVAPQKIVVTGNTVVDALYEMKSRFLRDDALRSRLKHRLEDLVQGRRHVLVTAHRRENHGAAMREIAQSVADLAGLFPTRVFIVPVHPHPEVRGTVYAHLSNIENVRLTEPLAYQDFLFTMMNADLLLSDSGGVQEEAATFGIPLLVLRNLTERPEALDSGTAELVGTNRQTIVHVAARTLAKSDGHCHGSSLKNPFGDGRAAGRIAQFFSSNGHQHHRNGNSAPVEPFAPSVEMHSLDESGNEVNHEVKAK
jgi:UDP-N-acetylglucosamine 2-epimerase (non-hydrolysing)